VISGSGWRMFSASSMDLDLMREKVRTTPWLPGRRLSEWFEAQLNNAHCYQPRHQKPMNSTASASSSSSSVENMTKSNYWRLLEQFGVAAHRVGCDVHLFADASDCWKGMDSVLRHAQKIIFIAGWDFNPHLQLVRGEMEEEPRGSPLEEEGAGSGCAVVVLAVVSSGGSYHYISNCGGVLPKERDG